ncbi:M24 family metallopeptidase [Singulisphaera sp. PoT]|uniref:M24 family metallopeptidase n=1 Tax=Singulisphaera sp. PoT TaxID=3411797 RepID=UPI003BF54ABB
MASGSQSGGMASLYAESYDTTQNGDATQFDRVAHTADDRPNTDTLPALADPTADHADEELARRREDIEEKHRRICGFLDTTGNDAIVLGRADSIAWFTSGGDLGQDLGFELGSILLYVNRGSRAVITDNVQSARVFEEELAGLGFQLKERPWFDDPDRIIAELSHNKRVVTDLAGGASPWPKAGDMLKALRLPLTRLERQRYRELGRTLALAVEATCRNFHQGEKEADLAGHLAHRLLREGVVPVDLRVACDDRLARYRQPTFKAAAIERQVTITATGRRHGLCASLSRTVSFGPADEELKKCHGLAAMVDATCIYFSRPQETVSEVIRKARRIYEKFDRPHEWTLDYLGFLTGYAPREALLLPDSSLALNHGTPLCWSPSVGAARSCDTVVVDSRGYENVTAAQQWPQIDVAVKGFVIPRPGILER